MSSSLRRFRRSATPLAAILLALPAIAWCLVLLAPPVTFHHVAAASHLGSRTRIDFDGALALALDIPARPSVVRAVPRPIERPARVFHDMVDTVGTSRGARAPDAIA